MRTAIIRALVAVAFAILFATWADSESLAAAAVRGRWSDWEQFARRFVQNDGRVIDLAFDQKSTSEGQSYVLFFALVANQRARFDAVLNWTSDNLCDGQIGERLPGWLWGKRDDGSWGIKDRNSASDGDLWLAYTLLEAGRLWRSERYTTLGRKLLGLIRAHEVADAGAAGPVLLPGSIGFALADGRFRIDPSYLPGFMFRYLATTDPRGPWAEIWNGYVRIMPTVAPAGVAPDVIVVDSKGRVSPDTERTPLGSYDAIRVYLWAGMSGENSASIIQLLAPYAGLIRKLGVPPEKVDPATGSAIESGYSPTGYSAAVLPFLSALHEDGLAAKQISRLRLHSGRARLSGPTNYYDQVLILFGLGWHDGEFRFDDAGRLRTRWAP